MKFLKLFILAFCLLCSFSLIAQENLDDVIDELVEKLDDAHDSSRKMRLAIIPLTQAGSVTTSQQTFGAYFAETLISRLAEKSDKFRLFERSRLDALMQEAALGQSGLMDAEAAIRLGELAPIDAVFSGTYTLLSKEIVINSRMIDVVSGEILLSFSSKVLLTSQLEGLFFRPQEKAENAEASGAVLEDEGFGLDHFPF